MRARVVILLFFLITLLSINAYSQSSFLEEGVGGTGFFVDVVIDDDGLSTIGLSAAYSIGGIMDFGVSVSTTEGSIDNNESTDLSFSMLYNMVVIKQNTLQPISVQLEGAYGYINTTSDYLDYYNLRRSGQGFNLGVSIYRRFFSDSILSFNIGGKINYRNYLTTTYDYTDPDLPEVDINLRSEDITYGGLGSIIFRPELWPIFNVKLAVIYNPSSESIEYRPSISIINPQF